MEVLNVAKTQVHEALSDLGIVINISEADNVNTRDLPTSEINLDQNYTLDQIDLDLESDLNPDHCLLETPDVDNISYAYKSWIRVIMN